MSKIAGINDADPRAPEWRRMLAQLNAESILRESPETYAVAQRHFDRLPFDPSPFEHFHEVICVHGHRLIMTNDELRKYGGLEVRRTSAERSGG